MCPSRLLLGLFTLWFFMNAYTEGAISVTARDPQRLVKQSAGASCDVRSGL